MPSPQLAKLMTKLGMPASPIPNLRGRGIEDSALADSSSPQQLTLADSISAYSSSIYHLMTKLTNLPKI